MLSMTVSMGMLIFAGLGYALEKDEPDTQFYTLPQTLYWAIITMTSTGERYTQFYTLPQTLYWAIITMTSTGERYTQFYTLPQTLYWAIITMTSTGERYTQCRTRGKVSFSCPGASGAS